VPRFKATFSILAEEGLFEGLASHPAVSPNTVAAILSAGNFIFGLGTAAFYPVGNTYLHDLFPEDNLKVTFRHSARSRVSRGQFKKLVSRS
jgi:hypothetical protein